MEHVPTARLCVQCGYDLRGADPAAVCPECGIPVANSRPLHGFHFYSDRSVRRALLGIGILAAALVWVGIARIAAILALWWIFQAPRNLVLAAVRCHFSSWSVLAILFAGGAWLIAQPFALKCDRHRRGLGLLTLGVLSIAAALGAIDLARVVLNRGNAPIWLYLSLLVCNGVGVVMVWSLLISRIDRRQRRYLWRCSRIALMIACVVLVMTVIDGWASFASAMGPALGWDEASLDLWIVAARRLTNWWYETARPIALMLLLAHLYVYARVLRHAWRSRALPPAPES